MDDATKTDAAEVPEKNNGWKFLSSAAKKIESALSTMLIVGLGLLTYLNPYDLILKCKKACSKKSESETSSAVTDPTTPSATFEEADKGQTSGNTGVIPPEVLERANEYSKTAGDKSDMASDALRNRRQNR